MITVVLQLLQLQKIMEKYGWCGRNCHCNVVVDCNISKYDVSGSHY